MKFSIPIILISVMILFLGCATVPGATAKEQITSADELIQNTLNDLYKKDPKMKEDIKNAVGYVVLNNKITKIPIVGAGRGYGVGVETQTGEKTYLKMARFDIGGGWGVRSVRPVIIFTDRDIYYDFVKGILSINAGAEAAAKVGETGTAGGADASKIEDDKGYKVHMITDAGVSATLTVGLIRVAPVKLKKD